MLTLRKKSMYTFFLILFCGTTVYSLQNNQIKIDGQSNQPPQMNTPSNSSTPKLSSATPTASAVPFASPQDSPKSLSEADELAFIQKMIGEIKADEKPSGLLKRLDKSLDTSLAVALAGLSLAAAVFLIGFFAPLAHDIKENVTDKGRQPSEVEKKQWVRAQHGVRQLTASFYIFIFFLVESLTGDHWEEPGSWLGNYDWAHYADPIIAGSSLALGVYLLVLGARTIRKIIIEENPPAGKGSQEELPAESETAAIAAPKKQGKLASMFSLLSLKN